jgi:acyl carrier protein
LLGHLADYAFAEALFAMEMVLFVEKEFSLTVENADLDPDNFRSVSALAAFVERKTGSGGPA